MKSKKSKTRIAAIDLFCGAGGLTHGLIKGGVEVRAGIDIDPDCRYPFEVNNKAEYIQSCVTKITPRELGKFFKQDEYSLIAGCAPCQPFSKYSKGKILDYEKWSLLLSFSKTVSFLKPDFVTMENVPQLLEHEIFDEFVSSLKKEGYHCDHKVVYCPDYGVPQNRSRLILLASKFGPVKIIEPTHLGRNSSKATVGHAIKSLKPLKAGEVDQKDPLHQARSLSDLNLERIRASKPDGTWRDWPKHLLAKCHQKESGSTFPSVYGRMSWEKPSPTITTQFFGYGNGRFGHPVQDRALSLREGAILQTFPKNYQFTPKGAPINQTAIGRMIGNAVPVRLGEIIAQSLQEHLKTL